MSNTFNEMTMMQDPAEPPRHQDRTNVQYWSKRWDRYSSLKTFHARTDSVLARFLDQATQTLPRGAGGEICELGCAPGAMLIQMAKLRPINHFNGVDYSEIGLEKAKTLLHSAGPSATFYYGDYFTMPPPQLFDLVISFGLLEHAKDPVAAISRHMAFAKPGAYVAVSIPDYSHPLVQYFAKRIDPEVFTTHNLSVMSTDALVKVMESAGLCTVHAENNGRAKIRTTCPNRTVIRLAWRSIAKLWNIISRVLPPGIPWTTSLWAIGKVPGAVHRDRDAPRGAPLPHH